MGLTSHPAVMSMRTLAFLAGYVILTVIWGSLGVLFGWLLPFRARFIFIIVIWTRMVMVWLRLTCGVRIVVEGLENLPKHGAYVVLSKHESSMETLLLQRYFAPVANVIKRELLFIPFFGWAFWMLKPITIDRSRPANALKKVLHQGKHRLAQGMVVVLFPEGTRTKPGELGDFHRSGAALAASADVPVVPVFHNTGTCWPAGRFLKRPGTVRVLIGAPIETAAKTPAAITQQARDWIVLAMANAEGEP